MGMSGKDADRLREMILRAILVNEAVSAGKNIHGERFTVDFQAFGLSRQVLIRTAWIIETGKAIPRLTSCYIKG